MAAAKPSHETIGNRLLAVLPKKDYRLIAPHLSPVSLDLNHIIHEAGDPVRYVYFPTSGVISILNTLGERRSIEVNTVGKEGMVGINVFWGVDTAPNQAVVQVPGDGVRMKASAFKNAVKRISSFQSLLNRYTYALMTQTSLSVACNRFHNVEKRFARLLLAICDRVDAGEFRLTQKYISQMLGAHRPNITTAASALQSAGLIRYSRGKIVILDCNALERAACGCYRNGKEKFNGLFGTSTS